MVRSMTAYASATGTSGSWSWSWELRSVNARGLDLRLRLPDWIEGLEPALRSAIRDTAGRGAVSLTLRLARAAEDRTGADPEAVDQALRQVAAIHARAAQQGMTLAPCTAVDILGMATGQGAGHEGTDETETLRDELIAHFGAEILAPFQAMRQAEGAALAAILSDHLDEIARLVETAASQAEARAPKMRDDLRAALARVTENADAVEPGRLAQELALLAVRADVTEEIDRLRVHVVAAREHLSDGGPIGRKLDFLTQEFNREANTLCAKSNDADLGATGLALKAAIDQMREQVQNVE